MSDSQQWFFADWLLHSKKIETTGLPLAVPLTGELKDKYNEILRQPSHIASASNEVLRLLWDTGLDDLEFVERLFLAALGIDTEDVVAHGSAKKAFRKVKNEFLQGAGIPRNPLVVSAFYRAVSDEIGTGPGTPDFVFWVRLVGRPGFQPKYQTVMHLFDWNPWIRPTDTLDLLFSRGHWGTLGAFREVLDAILGRHLLVDLPPMQIFRDKLCTREAKDEEPMSGEFFINLPTTNLNHFNPISRTTAPKRSSTFAAAVNGRCHGVCAASESSEPEEDIEAAHILPRWVNSH
ncbi:hypothetical protein B0H17DRAFT_1131580 [Mycena rosella]|uniref:Uncharacterized protein n=1 Tax=Mycena rosella TaxID=1033263 RepID=A0AAD7DQA1_MYCRO|nr:hypothetical protein B0H17DRAFT_1131580 [Mycena rosella]